LYGFSPIVLENSWINRDRKIPNEHTLISDISDNASFGMRDEKGALGLCVYGPLRNKGTEVVATSLFLNSLSLW